MDQNNERSCQDWERLQSAAQSKIGVLYNQLNEIDSHLAELWGDEKTALLKRRDKTVKLLERQPELVAEYAYQKAVKYLVDLADKAAPIKADLDEIMPKYEELVFELAEIEIRIRDEVEKEYASQPIPEGRDMYGNPAGRPHALAIQKRTEDMEKVFDARFSKEEEKFREMSEINEIETIVFDLNEKLEHLFEQAKIYGNYIDLFDPKTLQAAARRHALAALRGAENCRRVYLAGAFDKK